MNLASEGLAFEQLWKDRHVVCWLFDLHRADGMCFLPGKLYEVLRDDGDTVNLCEIDPKNPRRIGETITKVRKLEPYL